MTIKCLKIASKRDAWVGVTTMILGRFPGLVGPVAAIADLVAALDLVVALAAPRPPLPLALLG